MPIQRIDERTTTKNKDGYKINIKTYKDKKSGKSYRLVNHIVDEGNKNFNAEDNVNAMYKTLQEKYKDKRFDIMIRGPTGNWFTIGSNNGLNFKSYEDYFDGRVEDVNKFIDNITQVSVKIKLD